tara:strand:- start:3993 stop:4484 length:492 start_codon:yes stop_codon:yes gene_type:complete
MALNIKSIKSANTGTVRKDSKVTYTDLSLDFSMESTGTGKQLFSNSTRKDLRMDEDYKAISNSLINIFNTSPGQKILSPAFGADLRYYLFEPITEQTAQIIGDVILKSIELYETRVSVENITVIAIPDQNEYQIEVYLLIPSLNNSKFTFNGNLTDKGVTTNP